MLRRIFTNKDDSIGMLNLLCRNLTLNGEQVATLALQETLESRIFLQLAEVECLTAQAAHASDDYAKQPCIYVNLRSVQAGKY